MLQLIAGDTIFAQRPLSKMIRKRPNSAMQLERWIGRREVFYTEKVRPFREV